MCQFHRVNLTLCVLTDLVQFTPIGVSILHMLKRGLRQLASLYKQLLFRLQPSRFGIAERGKFDNVSFTPLVVAISKK